MTVYSLFGQSGGAALTADTTSYCMGMEFSLSTPAALTGIWWNSPAGAASTPVACCVYLVATQTQVTGTVNTSPVWSGAAGSGWIKCAYPGTVMLSAAVNYRVVIEGNGGAGNWYGSTSHFWDTGPGSGGLTSGIISAPNTSSSDVGQDSFTVSPTGLDYPLSTFNATNYWVDVEATTAAGPAAAAVPLAENYAAPKRLRAWWRY